MRRSIFIRAMEPINTIKHIRTTVLKINQEALAEAAGVTQPTVSRWERDELSPTIDEIKRVCAAYPSVKPERFFAHVSPAKQSPRPSKGEAA